MQHHQPILVTIVFAAMASTLVSSAGCARSTNAVRFVPVSTSRPVSLSDQYLDEQGNVVAAEQYRPIRSFSLEKKVEAAHSKSKLTALDLSGDLEQVIRTTGADAITNLRIEALDYDMGSHASSFIGKGFGWTLGIGGATLLLLGASADSGFMTTFGGVMIGTGLVSYLLGATAKKPTRWRFHVRGDAVKRSGAAQPSY